MFKKLSKACLTEKLSLPEVLPPMAGGEVMSSRSLAEKITLGCLTEFHKSQLLGLCIIAL